MRVLDLFSGIGGFSLGLERAGMRTVAFCEIDPYCRAVLARHWPGVPICGDIREVTAKTMADILKFSANKSISVEVICGGFPCQDISVAGKGAGLAGARSGLWSEYFRLIRELRPRYVIVENVAALLGRGLEQVLGNLASIGYDAEWHCIPASYVGAPHRRDRVWIVAYPQRMRELQPQGSEQDEWGWISDSSVGDTYLQRLSMAWKEQAGKNRDDRGGGMPTSTSWWSAEPDVGRVAHGIPARVDRLGALGNAVVPQVVEIIGRAIMRAEK